MCDRLLRANLHNRPEIVDEVSRLLSELRDAWRQIKPAAAAAPDTRTPR
jgi:flagellar protein FliS